jgi:hypothetical protein
LKDVNSNTQTAEDITDVIKRVTKSVGARAVGE